MEVHLSTSKHNTTQTTDKDDGEEKYFCLYSAGRLTTISLFDPNLYPKQILGRAPTCVVTRGECRQFLSNNWLGLALNSLISLESYILYLHFPPNNLNASV